MIISVRFQQIIEGSFQSGFSNIRHDNFSHVIAGNDTRF